VIKRGITFSFNEEVGVFVQLLGHELVLLWEGERGEDVVGDVLVDGVGQAINNNQLEVFAFENLFETCLSLFGVYS